MDQFYRQTYFYSISIKVLKPHEKRRDNEAIIILEKNDTTKKPKGRMGFNGKPTREWLSRDENSNTTASLESIVLTEIIDAY